ncbi:hypothetical protein EA462_15400 [Natrarchaeobius halalkaliphilus]|uniref:Uncharacterized protein n=1 Tax=Natrarchaeobius halalkaliphilus TaxID=1679091 RepID=A0A3N6NZN0_9EURY|nr:hypothetical protein [Natrarchaeobius halalkaliphilus]RQG87026.1 hypothetical protein EA462_15400 [Natrarchaeobius halalkaliphilus]
MPSHKANKHGTACEYHLAEKYRVDLVGEDGKRLDTSWYDGLKNGTPWEFKATAHKHADGNPGNFKVYKRYHGKLRREGGWYAFAVYRRRGTGTQVLKTEAVAASSLPTLRWHGGGDHRGTEQAKISISDVF